MASITNLLYGIIDQMVSVMTHQQNICLTGGQLPILALFAISCTGFIPESCGAASVFCQHKLSTHTHITASASDQSHYAVMDTLRFSGYFWYQRWRYDYSFLLNILGQLTFDKVAFHKSSWLV